MAKEILLRVENENLYGRRLDVAMLEAAGSFGEKISRTYLQNLITNGHLFKNDEIFTATSYKIRDGDVFRLLLPDVVDSHIEARNIPLDIVYEDSDLAIINKQAGLTTHPGAGNHDETLVNALLHHCGNTLSGINGVMRPGIVHRLDKDTSGLMVIAKNDSAHRSLAEQIETRELKRVYWALVWGAMAPPAGSIEGYIDRHRVHRLKMQLHPEFGRYSRTNYETLKIFASKSVSLVECRLDTGRTHQIRVHLSSRRHPLVGDELYGGRQFKMKSTFPLEVRDFVNNFPRQALHSKSISLRQPTTGETLFFEVDPPDDMTELIQMLESVTR